MAPLDAPIDLGTLDLGSFAGRPVA